MHDHYGISVHFLLVDCFYFVVKNICKHINLEEVWFILGPDFEGFSRRLAASIAVDMRWKTTSWMQQLVEE